MKKLLAVVVTLMMVFALCASAEEAAVANPWTVTDEQSMINEIGFAPQLPENATDAEYSMMITDDEKIGQLVFKVDGMEYVVRVKATAETETVEDISGWNCEWENEEEVQVHGYMNGYIRIGMNGENQVEEICWLDVVPGMVWSLSTEQNDVNGLDIQCYAEEVCPMQEDA